MSDRLKIIKDQSWKLKNTIAKEDWISIKYLVNAMCEPFDQEKIATRCVEKATPGSKYWGMTVEEVIAKWNEYSQNRTITGMTFDTYTQFKLTNTPCTLGDNITDEQKLIFNHFDQLKEYVLDKEHDIKGEKATMEYLGSEIWVSSPTGIRGKMDSLFWLLNGYVVWDWKNFDVPNDGFTRMLGPLSSLKNSDFNKATLQLYLYKYILETDYELPVSGVRIGMVNKNCWNVIKPTFKYDTKLMNEIIDFGKNVIINQRKEQEIKGHGIS